MTEQLPRGGPLPGALAVTDTPLRIIQVVNVRWFNATAWYGLFLSRLLRDAGHDVRVLALAGTDSFAKAQEWGLDPIAVPLNTANPFLLPFVYAKLSHLVRAFSPHIVNCHRGEGFFLWGLLKAAGHSFTLVRTRGDQRPPKNTATNRLLHSCFADALIATNSPMAEKLRALGVAPECIHTILGGVDTSRFYPDLAGRVAMRKEWGIGDGEKVVGLLGRFDPVKGHATLIHAIAKVRSECPNIPVRLVLAGFPAGISKQAMLDMVRNAGLTDQVILTGKVPDVRACISAFDLGVVASTGSETIARAALEIMACGVPLVSTNIGVMPDLLAPSALVPSGNVSALAGLVRRTLVDQDFAANLAAEQKICIDTLSARAFLEQTMAVYASAQEKENA